MRVTTNSDPKAGASSEGNVLFERLRERLTEESFVPRVLCVGYKQVGQVGGSHVGE
jgi:hypothetical protein